MDLSRFTQAHELSYPIALREIKSGKKFSCWMWYIFPQVRGRYHSSMSRQYAIQDIEEAKAFLADPCLGKNLCEISSALLELETNDPYLVFSSPDDEKLRACMTLFASISEDHSVFHQVLDKYFHGKADQRTINILQNQQ